MVGQSEVRGLFSFLFPLFRLYSSFDSLLLCDGVIAEFVLLVTDELGNWATNVLYIIARPPRRQGSASCCLRMEYVVPCTLQAIDKVE